MPLTDKRMFWNSEQALIRGQPRRRRPSYGDQYEAHCTGPRRRHVRRGEDVSKACYLQSTLGSVCCGG